MTLNEQNTKIVNDYYCRIMLNNNKNIWFASLFCRLHWAKNKNGQTLNDREKKISINIYMYKENDCNIG